MALLQRAVVICAVVVFVAAYPMQSPDDSDSALGSILENVKGFNASGLIASFRLPPCVQDCVDDLANAVDKATADGTRWSMEKTKLACGQYDLFKSCLATKPMCNSIFVEIGMHILEFFCNDNKNVTGLIPCVRREAMKIHATCERECKLGATLMDAANLNTKSRDALNFIDESGNKILSVPDLHVLCNTSTCFLSCMRTGIEQQCPNEGNSLIDNIATSVMRKSTMNEYLPETKAVDAYTSLISSVLPKQCQHLILQEKNIMLTTPGAPFTFVTDSHDSIAPTPAVLAEVPAVSANGNSPPASDVLNGNKLRDAGVSAKNEEDGMKSSAGSTNTAILPVLVSTLLLTVSMLV